MRVGILYIATGPYKRFFDRLYESVSQHFLPGHEKTIFVFTDEIDQFSRLPGVQAFQVDYNRFPLDTLLRFRFFCRYQKEIEWADRLIFMNANLVVERSILAEEFFAQEDKYSLWVVTHPGYFDKRPKDMPFESNPKSTAYVKPAKGARYVQGCLFAGDTGDFLDMSARLDANIMMDLRGNRIAAWHDESHLNRFFQDHPYYALDPGFAYPEGWNLPFEKKIVQLDKAKFFNKDSA
jgi:hypothetical protein